MRPGSSIEGRVVFEGMPVANKTIGIVEHNMFAGSSVDRGIQTDELGRFRFFNLRPDLQYALYTVCDWDQPSEEAIVSPTKSAVMRTKVVNSPESGKSVDLGDIALEPGHVFTGQVGIAEGAGSLGGLRIRLGRSPAFDWLELPISDDGTFRIEGLAHEVYSVSINADDMEIDPSKFSHQILGPTRFGIRLRGEQATTELEIPLKRKE